MNKTPIIYKAKDKHDRWKSINWIMISGIACLGLIVVGLVGIGFFRMSGLYRKYYPLTNAVLEMRIEAVTAYLWFEEMINGNGDEHLDAIWSHLDRADWYAKIMIMGSEDNRLKLIPSERKELYTKIIDLQNQLKEQRELLNKRLKLMSSSKPGSVIDKVYHEKLDEFVKQSNLLELDVKKIMAHENQVLIYVWMGIIICCLCLFFAAGLIFYRYERLRRNHYLDLLNMQRRIVRNEKMAALGALISGIAHEVNNPNGVILFNIPILREYFQVLVPIIDDCAKRHSDFEHLNMSFSMLRDDLFATLNNIENGSKRINSIVSNLKEFRKKREHSENVPYDLGKVVERVEMLFGSKIRDEVQAFKISTTPLQHQLYGDPEIVELILINFLKNAVEAMDKADRRIELNVNYSQDKDNPGIIIEVVDNGTGIDASDIERIFDPFYSTKSTKGGSGLGLYLCNALADQIGACLEAESILGQGSTFRLILSLK